MCLPKIVCSTAALALALACGTPHPRSPRSAEPTAAQHARVVDSVTWGFLCGMCGPRSVVFYRIDAHEVRADTRGRFSRSLFSAYAFSGEPLPAETHARLLWILDAVPEAIFRLAPAVVGDPDDHDQGGYYLEVHGKGRDWRLLVDAATVAPELEAFLTRLFSERPGGEVDFSRPSPFEE